MITPESNRCSQQHNKPLLRELRFPYCTENVGLVVDQSYMVLSQSTSKLNHHSFTQRWRWATCVAITRRADGSVEWASIRLSDDHRTLTPDNEDGLICPRIRRKTAMEWGLNRQPLAQWAYHASSWPSAARKRYSNCLSVTTHHTCISLVINCNIKSHT